VTEFCQVLFRREEDLIGQGLTHPRNFQKLFVTDCVSYKLFVFNKKQMIKLVEVNHKCRKKEFVGWEKYGPLFKEKGSTGRITTVRTNVIVLHCIVSYQNKMTYGLNPNLS
jgi:hypothetical protein